MDVSNFSLDDVKPFVEFYEKQNLLEVQVKSSVDVMYHLALEQAFEEGVLTEKELLVSTGEFHVLSGEEKLSQIIEMAEVYRKIQNNEILRRAPKIKKEQDQSTGSAVLSTAPKFLFRK